MQSVRLLRSRSGTSALPRLQPAAGDASATPPSPEPFSSNSSSSSRRTAMLRSKSTTKDRPPAPVVDSSPPSTTTHRRVCKENCKTMSPRLPLPDAASARPKQKATPASAWALSPGRSSPRAATAPPSVGRKKDSSELISPWARSPGRSPPPKPAADPSRRIVVAPPGGKRGGVGGGMLGLFRRKKVVAAMEEEEASHKLRILASRLAQWRFVNARTDAAMEATRCNSEVKVCHAWLKIYELRNLVAAKRILIQRRKQRLKVAHVLNPQLHLLLSQWEPHANKHVEAVATLGKALEAATSSLPLVRGAQVDMVSIHQHMGMAMRLMNDIASSIGAFYPNVKEINSKLSELTKTTLLEMEGLEQLKNMYSRITAMEMHEVSLMAHLIQAAKEEDSISRSQQCSSHVIEAYVPIRSNPYHLLLHTNF